MTRWCVATSAAPFWSGNTKAISVFVWFAALSVAGVLAVFRDPRLDHRLVALGALAPLFIDALISVLTGHRGRTGPLHALPVMVLVLVVAMLASINRRPFRKRLLAFVIGGFAHLVLDGAWLDTKSFLWPITRTPAGARLQVLQRSLVLNLAMEAIGIGFAVFLYQRCRLSNTSRRKSFLSSGSLELLPIQRRR